jgi:DNA-binding beta-propeller fold protein YncE
MRIGALFIGAILPGLLGCSPIGDRGSHSDGGGPAGDGAGAGDFGGDPLLGDAGSQAGCASQTQGCYTVYAHADHVLYRVDLASKTLIEVGPFKAPLVPSGSKMVEDTITDLAVAPDDTIYVISHTTLYTASAADGHVTSVGAVTTCGTEAVAMTFTPDGSLYAGDYKGAFCKIDLTTMPPAVKHIGTLGGGLALAGDLVAVADGTMYGTAYKLSDPSKSGTQLNNLLVKLDPASGTVTQQIGPTGSAELFGVAYALGQVFGFTHDGSGHVVTIDPKTGTGTLFNTFHDPTTGMGIAFAGAGVNSMVSATIQ